MLARGTAPTSLANKIFERLTATDTYKKFATLWLAQFTFRIFGWPKFQVSHYFQIKQAAAAVKGQSGLLAFASADKKILNYKVNHLFTNCEWGHAGIIYWGADGELRTKEMLADGLNDRYLLDLLREIDDFALLFIPMTPEAQAEALRRIGRIDEAPKKVEYDFTLDLNPILIDWVAGEAKLNEGKIPFRAYCSALVYLIANGLAADGFAAMTDVLGKPVFEPDDVYMQSQKLFEEHN